MPRPLLDIEGLIKDMGELKPHPLLDTSCSDINLTHSGISSEGDEDEDNLPCLVVENAPPPHVIFRSDSPNSISSLTSLTPPPPSSPSPPANSDRGGFPELDSALLRVSRT